MRPAYFVIPGDLSSPTGGYAYDRSVLALAGQFGVDLRHLALPGSYPAPTAADLDQTRRLIAETPADAVLLIDGLAFGAMPADLIRSFNRTIVALVHHPLGLESGIGEARSRALIESERAALALVSLVIVTSRLTAKTLIDDFAVPPAKLSVAEPGVEPRKRAKGSANDTLSILAVGAISPRKGYDVLIEALAPLADRDWRLTIAGAIDRAPQTYDELDRLAVARRLERKIFFAGAVSDGALQKLYGRTDLFVLSSHYEGYGMALAEAMAHGLAIVSTRAGAAADTVPDGAALKVPPGDVVALSDALRRALENQPLRRRLADASWTAGQELPRWTDTVRRIADALRTAMNENLT